MIRIQINSAPNLGNSTVGMTATLGCRARYTMELSKRCPPRIIRHEFFHALGFLHDHQSPYRPFLVDLEGVSSSTLMQSFVNVLLLEAIEAFETTRALAESEVEHQYASEDVGIFTRYDVTSISQ